MYHPSRGGVRGGRDQFNWEDVKGDKHRENYIGHSLKAPVGRWQKGKDLFWYTKDKSDTLASQVAKEEIERIKLEEEQAIQEALGLAPKRSVRPSGNQLDKREVAELLKKGSVAEDLAGTYAVGERVEGLGFTPAPGQRKNKKISMSGNAEHEDTLIKLDSLAGFGNPMDSSIPTSAASQKRSMAEGVEVSQQTKKQDKKTAREVRRQEKKVKRLARKEEKAKHRKEKQDRHKGRSRQESPGSDDPATKETAPASHGRWHYDSSSSHSRDEAMQAVHTPRNQQVLSHLGVSVKTVEMWSLRRRHDSDSSSYSSEEAKDVKDTLRDRWVLSHTADSLKTSELQLPVKQRRRHDSDASGYSSDEAKEVRKRLRNGHDSSHVGRPRRISEKHLPVKRHSRHDPYSSSYSSDEAKYVKNSYRDRRDPSHEAVSEKASEKRSAVKRRRRHDSDSSAFSDEDRTLKKQQNPSPATESEKPSQMCSLNKR